MRTALRWSVRLTLLVVLLGALLLANLIWFKPVFIRVFFDRVFVEFGMDNPEMLSSMRMFPPWMNWYEDDLADASPAKEEESFQKLKSDYATLKRYDRAGLEPDAQVSYDMLDYFLRMQVEGEPYRYHNYPLNQLFGVQNDLPTFMATQHQVRDAGSAADYIARLDKFPLKFDQVLEGLALREQRRILPPRFVIEKVLAEMRAFVAAKPQDNILYTSFVEKLQKIAPDAMPEAEREQLKSSVADSIASRVYPAYGKFIAYYETLLPKVTENNGVWALPDGDAYYAHEVRSQTTTDMTPEQVHALGLSEVARIEAEMDVILREQGLADGSIGDRMREIAKRPDQLYPDSDAGRTQILADYQAIIDEMNAGLGPYFNVRPKQGVTVERVPEFKEKTAPGAYYNPAAFDGSRPGTFYANLRNVDEIPRFSMRTLSYHEAIPGHHFQITVQQELTGVPIFRKVLPFTAFSEGWALYAERLAWEIGFEKNPLDNLGRLQAEMFRAVRLVVDTGMHAKHWTREQAIDYMLANTGMAQDEVVAEIERYLVMPGQALAYKVGMNKILELRERAKAKLGAKFDLAKFHDFVLTGGGMPMVQLEQRVDGWIAAQGAGATP